MNNIKSQYTDTQNRFMSIDYLKAIAVILVIVNHSLTNLQKQKIGGPFWISMAVPIFMIVSGFTHSISADNRDIRSLREYFDRETIMKKLSGFMFPYLIIFALELVLKSVVPIGAQSVKLAPNMPILFSFLLGGIGPGSYYIPILLQLLFLFPLMYFAYKRSPYISIGFFFLIQIGFDVSTNLFSIPGGLYRLLIFRYLSFIIMGIGLYFNRDKIKLKEKNPIFLFSIISLIYIYIVSYTGYRPVIFTFWTETALPIIFLAISLVFLGMKYLEIEDTNWLTNLTSLIGKSSFHIFLVQKLSFGLGLNKFFKLINITGAFKVLSAIVVCLTLGIAFYYFEINLRDILSRSSDNIFNYQQYKSRFKN